MKFTSCCATLVILCMTIGCGTQTETHSIDTFPVSESENMPVSESEKCTQQRAGQCQSRLKEPACSFRISWLRMVRQT